MKKAFAKILALPDYVLFGTALLIRTMAFWVFGDQRFPDSEIYVSSADELLASGRIENHIYMPLYPLLIGLVGGRTGAIVMDILISSLFPLLMKRLSMRVFQIQRVAQLTALVTVFYPFFIFYSFSVLTETIYLFLIALMMLLFYERRARAGAFVGVLALLVKPVTELFLLPMVICFERVVEKNTWFRTLCSVGWAIAFYLILMSPWWVHNGQKYGQFVRLTLGEGIVFYSGHNPLNKSGGGLQGGVDVDLSRFDGIKDPVERNRAMKIAAFEYIKADPIRAVRMAFVKFWRIWRPWPHADQYSGMKFVVISLVSFVPVLMLALWTMARFTRDEWLRVSPIIAFIVYLTAVHMATIGSIRYRLPMEPFLILFAAYACCRTRTPELVN